MRLDQHYRVITKSATNLAIRLEAALDADVVFFSGVIEPSIFDTFREYISDVKAKSKKPAIAVFLRTPGGSVETTERLVSVLRHHYNLVYFVVPDIALSAGTILCMSGDKIFMDYSSSLGPIDPQIFSDEAGRFIPALGYLDKVNEIVEKRDIKPGDVILLKSIDLGTLALFEQARELSVDLLKEWLVTYKFKDWTKHRTTNPGAAVEEDEKIARATDIAKELSNNKRWRSHGRHLNIEKLRKLGIEIDDYTNNPKLTKLIREFHELLVKFNGQENWQFFIFNGRVGIR